MRHILIVAGGSGTRLWPLSRHHAPKQVQTFFGQESLLQQTYQRAVRLVPPERIWVITADKWQKVIAQQLPDLPEENILGEPVGKNTAPAIAFGTWRIREIDDKAVIASLPADQYIGLPEIFHQALERAFLTSEKYPDFVVTIGLKPTKPDTGLGYIKLGQELDTINDQIVWRIAKFVEKPDLSKAKRYLASGQYLWNGGFFIFQAQTMLKHFADLEPKMLKELKAYVKKPDKKIYHKLESKAIDTAIMEKIRHRAVVPAQMEWSDVGSWETLHQVFSSHSDTGSGVLTFRGEHHDLGSKDCLVIGQERLIATVGLENLVIVDTDDAILICNKNKTQEVKTLVEQLEEQGRGDLL